LILLVGREDLAKSSKINAVAQGAGELSAFDNKKIFSTPPEPLDRDSTGSTSRGAGR
jgi:hypothetical protein